MRIYIYINLSVNIYIYIYICIYIYNESLVVSCIKKGARCPLACEQSSKIRKWVNKRLHVFTRQSLVENYY